MSDKLTFVIQYLEPGPGVADLPVADVRQRLRHALALLPIRHVLIGWDLPAHLLTACREECQRAGARFYRWHPLLTSDGAFQPRPEWQTIGLGGEPVPGYQDLPEFTFVCPNKPSVQATLLTHLDQLIHQGGYDGFFLDRIRFPSPATDPSRWLACFCADCQRAAAHDGLDLPAAQRAIQRLLATPENLLPFLATLLNDSSPAHIHSADLALLRAFLHFRVQSVTNFVLACANLIHQAGLAVGLDCFSPALTHMVGQNLKALDGCADWIKVMSYCHTLGPAGLPFELFDLANWLVTAHQIGEDQALVWLAQTTGLSLPASRAALRSHGLPPATLVTEMARGQAAQVKTLWAGMELVEIAGVAQLTTSQIAADWQALQSTKAQGVVISWDLWHIPHARLVFVHALGI